MLYLKIENVGECPVEAFLTLGVSTTRYAGSDGTIGEFGSGAKMATILLLRETINPVIFCGKTRLEFYTEPLPVDDSISVHDFERVCCRVTRQFDKENPDLPTINRTEKTSITTDYGAKDWNDINMAMREYVSNALDMTYRKTGSYKSVTIETVNDNQVRAKRGTTRIFVPLSQAIQKFYNELPKRFLFFNEQHILQSGLKVLEKRDRNIRRSSPMIYKHGVLVRELLSPLPSLFDYNLNDLQLDECRNSDEYTIQYYMSRALIDAPNHILRKYFDSFSSGTVYYEHKLPESYMSPSCHDGEEKVAARKQRWQAAWDEFAGENAVVSSEENKVVNEIAARKGYKVVEVKDSVLAAAKANGIKEANTVVTEDEKQGKEILPVTADVITTLDDVWEFLTYHGNFTKGKEKPAAACFNKIMTAESQTLGFYKDSTCYIHKDISVGQSDILWQTMLEEVAHYITGATDNSRDFQDFAFRVVTACRNSAVVPRH